MDGYLVLVNHPYDGLRYKSCHASAEEAEAACKFDINTLGPPAVYEFIVVQGTVKSLGPPTAEEPPPPAVRSDRTRS